MHITTQKQITIILDEIEAEDLYNYLIAVYTETPSSLSRPPVVSDLMDELLTEGVGR